jgi:hypothetical protein
MISVICFGYILHIKSVVQYKTCGGVKMKTTVSISVNKRNGHYVPAFAPEAFAQYTDGQMAGLVKHIDGNDVIECAAETDGEGNIQKIFLPIPA